MKNKLLEPLKEITAACAAAMRVIYRQGENAVDDFETELLLSDIPLGFGKRANQAIKEADGAMKGATDGKANTI